MRHTVKRFSEECPAVSFSHSSEGVYCRSTLLTIQMYGNGGVDHQCAMGRTF